MNELILSGADTTTLYDPQTGSCISSLNIPPGSSRAMAVVPSKNGQGGLIFSVAAYKPLLHVYSFQKNQPLHNFVLPEKVSCLDVDPNGIWCAAGTASGRVYFWEVGSGALFKSFAAHYRAVTALRFHSNGETFITGSEDSSISIWSISRIVDYEYEADVPSPLQTLTDHTLPITCVYVGFGNLASARIFSSSLDSTVKVWTIDPHTTSDSPDPSASLLVSFKFSLPIENLVADHLERSFFAATSTDAGEVFVVRMYSEKKDNSPFYALATGSIGELHDVVTSTENVLNVGSRIITIALSLTSKLLVGTQQGNILIYDTVSLQLLRTIQTSQSPAASPVTFLTTLLKPLDLLGHTQLSLSGKALEDSVPIRPVMPFGRARDVKGKGREVAIVLPKRTDPTNMEYDPFEDHMYFSSRATLTISQTPANEDPQDKILQLEAEVKQLRMNLDRAKTINDAMWENVLQSVVAQSRAMVE
ncbi:Pre-rRNA-processing protein ipi3 [Serendipita sp. 407]|nr:Pre-rRNA-processing protein ipi3 [Serendipita sp. 407]